jgi:hypothetical protein
MNSTTYSEFEDWLPRPAALRLAFALWIAGFLVAGAATWRMHRPGPAPTDTSAVTTEVTQAPESSEPGSVEVIPEDVVVGHRPPSTGATLRQKP